MKKWIAGMCVLMLLFGLSGCEQLWEQIFGADEHKIAIQQQEYDEDDYEEITDLISLRDYVVRQYEEDKLEFAFRYTGEETFDPGLIAQMAGVCFVKSVQQGDVYQIAMSAYPGDRIVKAYFQQDTSDLSRDEKRALEIAVQMVQDAQMRASDSWELELLLHDMLANRITYSTAQIDYEEPEDQPRHLSVIGALLDGEANCQGYTDAFYTLASIAGFRVGRLSVETDADPHMVNTILLGDSWYVVDVTYDDSAEENVSYHLLNAGLDMIGQQFWWDEIVNPYPIAEVSDENNYYIRNDLCFSKGKKMASYVAEAWADQGQTVIQVMLQNESDGSLLNEILPDALRSWGIPYEYRIWYCDNGTDSFYTIAFY